ncbi:MAG: molecular chaperone TorD family protein [Coriobacteriales bacterium]|jgi:TorA maturation chaperone TorD|nr:molecular chaperone TorD family protein [Coriobacteriales bacterium]
MVRAWNELWQLRADLYAFFGNSMLKTMTIKTAMGLDPSFWEQLPIEASNEFLQTGVVDLIACGRALEPLGREKAVERVAIEYTRLFIGPAAPAAPPWESLYRAGSTVLFGQPTFEMRKLFAQVGVEASAESHQFEDHLGFELLYLGVNSAHFATVAPSSDSVLEQQEFIRSHPLSFIEPLLTKAREAATVGYYPALIQLVRGYLLWDLTVLEGYRAQQ